MNFPSLAHCHLETTESNITCWAKWYLQGRSGQGNAELGEHTMFVRAPIPACCISVLMAFICISLCRASSFQMNVSLTSVPIQLLPGEADPNSCVCTEGKHCPGQGVVPSCLGAELAISPSYSLARGQE